MLRLVLKKIKRNFSYYLLIFIGYFSALLVISVGFVFLKSSKDMTIEYTFGKIEHQRLISINVSKPNSTNYDTLVNVLKKYSKTTSIRINGLIEKVSMDEKIFEVPVQPIVFSKTPEWIPEILSGRYLYPNESSSKAKIAVIGKGVENNKLSKNNYINLGKEKFKVVGKVGGRSKFSNYLGSVFIPLESLPDKMKENIEAISVYLLKNSDNPEKEMNEILDDLNKLSNIKAKEVEIKNNLSEFHNTLLMTTLVSCLIILVAVGNISILIFYLMLKNKKNISISIALGANRKMIWKQIFMELMLVSVCAIVCSIAAINLLTPFAKDNLTDILNIKDIEFSYLTILVASIVTMLMSFLISIISVKKFFNLNLTMELKGE
ncbi:ABC transporter permease [Clostridium rectalis]|uniref:ABC transporter permease n=1 Tax=Clostridium rectalis TaxID=2040295 RepID=UPI000F637E03|nr:ABC transporter permease [Clostridium rectalis]